MNLGWTLAVIAGTLAFGIAIAYIGWVCFVKPRIEGAQSRDEQDSQETIEDLHHIQDQAQRVKDSAQNIQEHVVRLQQMTRAREHAEQQRVEEIRKRREEEGEST